MTEYRIKPANNGYILTAEVDTDNSSFSEYEMTDYVFTDKDSLIAWLQGNLK